MFALIWIALVAVAVSFLKEAEWLHSWWKSALIVFPEVAVPVIAFLELRHSAEANQLRSQGNDLRKTNNELHERITELEKERNEHLQQIAQNTKRPRTHGERNADLLRAHLCEAVKVTEGSGGWGPAQIAEISEDNILTLFIPSTYGTQAWCQQVHCDDLEVVSIPGVGLAELKIRKRYGNFVQLGEIKKYDERHR
jgi:hypothetical protein